MSDRGEPFAELRSKIVGESGVIMLMGAADTGKTTLAKFLIADALGHGMTAAFVDADVSGSTVGPPACVGLKWISGPDDFATLGTADELRFVGSTQPQGVVLPHVVAATALVDVARLKADLVVLDTTSVVSGVVGQTLKYHLMELCSPNLVIALQRGAELEPIVGMLQRFLGARVAKARPPTEVHAANPMDLRASRIEAFGAALAAPLAQWRVQPEVFAPTLPEGMDMARLDSTLVGVQDEAGRCLGLGALEYEGGLLKVATRHGEEMKGLRLGSLRINLTTFDTTRVRLRDLMFGV